MNRTLPKQLITTALLVFFYLNLVQFANAQCPTTAADFSIGCGSSASLIADPAFVSYTPCSPTVITGTSIAPLLVNTFNSDGWQHFFNGSGDIYFSIKGNIGATPTATVKINAASFQFPNVVTNCPTVNPNE